MNMAKTMIPAEEYDKVVQENARLVEALDVANQKNANYAAAIEKMNNMIMDLLSNVSGLRIEMMKAIGQNE